MSAAEVAVVWESLLLVLAAAGLGVGVPAVLGAGALVSADRLLARREGRVPAAAWRLAGRGLTLAVIGLLLGLAVGVASAWLASVFRPAALSRTGRGVLIGTLAVGTIHAAAVVGFASSLRRAGSRGVVAWAGGAAAARRRGWRRWSPSTRGRPPSASA